MRDPQLWQRLKAYTLAAEPKPSSGRQPRDALQARLEDRLSWTADYAAEAIREYRRFLYLARVSDRQATPSEVIDEVWHEHMGDSRDYLAMCKAVFGEILHHEPCSGSEEMPRYADQYAMTRALYSEEFGDVPPPDVWVHRTAEAQARDERRGRAAAVLGIASGIAAAAVAIILFDWRMGAVIAGFGVGAVVQAVLTPRVPGPKTKSNSSESGCGGCGG